MEARTGSQEDLSTVREPVEPLQSDAVVDEAVDEVFTKRLVDVDRALTDRLAPLAPWQRYLIPAAGPVLYLLGLIIAFLVAPLASPDFLIGDFFAASTAALLTIAGIVPAAIGLAIVGRPSLRIDRSRVVLRWGPLANSILWAGAWFVTSLLALLALLGVLGVDGQGLALPGSLVLTSSLVVVIWAFFLVATFMLRLTSRVSSVQSVLAAQGTGTDILKDLRDTAIIEAKSGDRRAVRDRMFALCEIAVQAERRDMAEAALEELAFLGQEQVLDRDQALDAVHLLLRASERREGFEIKQIVMKELSDLWSTAIEVGGSPQIGLHCSFAMQRLAKEAGRPVFVKAVDRVLEAVRDRGSGIWSYRESEVLLDLSRVIAVVWQWTPKQYLAALVRLGDDAAHILVQLIKGIASEVPDIKSAPPGQAAMAALVRMVAYSPSRELAPLHWFPSHQLIRELIAEGHGELALTIALEMLTTKVPDVDLGETRRGILFADVILLSFDLDDRSLMSMIARRKIGPHRMPVIAPVVQERIELMATRTATDLRRAGLAVGVHEASEVHDADDLGEHHVEVDDVPEDEKEGALEDRVRFVLEVTLNNWKYGWASGDGAIQAATVRELRRLTSASVTSMTTVQALQEGVRIVAAYVQEGFLRAAEEDTEQADDKAAMLALQSWPLLVNYGGRYSLAWCGVLGLSRDLTASDISPALRTTEARSDLALRLAMSLLESDAQDPNQSIAGFLSDRDEWFSRLDFMVEDAVDAVYWLFLRFVVGNLEQVTAIHSRIRARLEEFDADHRAHVADALARLYATASIVHDSNDDVQFAEIEFRLASLEIKRTVVPSVEQWEALCALIDEHEQFLSRQSMATKRTVRTEAAILGTLARLLAKGLGAGLPFRTAVRTIAASALTDPAKTKGTQETAITLLRAIVRNGPEHLETLASDVNVVMNAHGTALRRLPIENRIQIAIRISISLTFRGRRGIAFRNSTVAFAALAVAVVLEVEANPHVRPGFDPLTETSYAYLSDLVGQIKQSSMQFEDGWWWREVERDAANGVATRAQLRTRPRHRAP